MHINFHVWNIVFLMTKSWKYALNYNFPCFLQEFLQAEGMAYTSSFSELKQEVAFILLKIVSIE